MRSIECLLLTRKAMLSILTSQHSRRGEYRGTQWMDVEIDVMHHAVNCERSKRALPDIDRATVVNVERMAAGHSDYASKFALYCAELALSDNPSPDRGGKRTR